MSAFLVVSAVALLVAAAAMGVTAVVARRTGRFAVVDVTWGIALSAVSVAAPVTGAVLGSGDWRGWVLLVLVSAWGLRLAWHIARRSSGAEDPRYAEMLAGLSFARAAVKVFVVQGAAVWLVSLPVQTGSALGSRWPWLVLAGVLLWLVGVIFETVGDAQLAAYKRDPQRGPVMDRGLWRYTRHPNYFGDACVWWGIWIVGALAAGWLPALLTLLAPLAMTYLLVFGTGARLLERSMMQRPGYPEYAARTSMFFPLPPKNRPAAPM